MNARSSRRPAAGQQSGAQQSRAQQSRAQQSRAQQARAQQARAQQARAQQAGARQGRPGQPGRPRPGRPLPKGPLYTPGAGSARRAVETRSARTVLLLHQLPKWLLPLVMVVLLVTGLAVRGPGGGAALVALTAVLGWLAYISWPQLSGQGRLLRGAAVLVMLVLAAVQSLR